MANISIESVAEMVFSGLEDSCDRLADMPNNDITVESLEFFSDNQILLDFGEDGSFIITVEEE
jgi:hypothetical protein